MPTATQKERLRFETETKQLLHLVTHALYSHEEIFLRELISNSADAIDKIRFAALKDDKLYENDHEFKIEILLDKEANTITIRDNGIGMNRDDVIANLGTIAKSGTREFLAQLSGDQAKDSKLIGQFGVGFYSSFIVADRVVVSTRRGGDAAEAGVRWSSDGSGEYDIETINKSGRGTEITLHLKKDKEEFLEPWRLRTIITKYSDYIDIPIYMEKPPAPPAEGDEAEQPEAKADEDQMPEWEQVNRAKALWLLPKSEIKEEDYKEFYKHISHDFEDPLLWSLNRVEGKQEYTSLLYVPSQAPFDLWNRDHSRGLKLYVRRVFIMDEAEQFLPTYLRFVKGVIDSQDLPLNISREILQNNRAVEAIRSGIIKRVLGMLEKLAKEDESRYQTFWSSVGKVLKEGPGEDFANRERIAKLLRFASTHSDSEEQTVSLDAYIARMKPEQDKIYYVTANSFTAAKNSPHLEVFRKKEIEVLLLSDHVDEWLASHLTEFDGKTLQSVTKGDLDLGGLEKTETETEKKAEEEKFSSLIEQMKSALTDKVKDIRVTHRLTDSPACLVVDDNEMSANLQRLMQSAGQQVPAGKPILELNPDHAIIARLRNEQDESCFNEWSNILFDQAMLAEGGKLDDPAAFVKRLNKMLLTFAANQ
ncbi:MAG: molecular chaperone HtpG [Gammaproteobacteria bacterium]|nr:molecular chaperone HtpG [Gammaproteobacteria bacterium]